MGIERLKGQLIITARGFGFVQTETGPDILIPFDHLSTGTSGDTVTAEVFADSAPDKPAGRIAEIVKRSVAPVVGRVRRHGKELRLYPEDQRVPRALVISAGDEQSFGRKAGLESPLSDGDVVVADLIEWDSPTEAPRGRIREFVGRRGDPNVDLKLIALARDLPLEFPPEVIAAAGRIAMPDPKSLGGARVDLRATPCFTIDPESARDFDDAISIEQLESGLFRVGVHIADVSHYVPEGSEIDIEARQRGTSVYLVSEVLPMLPEHLSNGVCSLVPGEPRLAYSVLVTLDSRGGVHDVHFTESLIESARRFTYGEVEEILHGSDDELAPKIRLLHLVTLALQRERAERGSVRVEFSVPRIRLDENGVPVSIRPSERLEANRMVEECMLLANRLVAEHVSSLDLPFLYRVHDQPRSSDVEHLVSVLADLGIPYRVSGEVKPEDYRNILSIIENLEFRDFVEALAMRSLTKAVYSTESRGHFGLALGAYTHFTSPIRRYTDLVVHRLLKRYVGKKHPRIGNRLLPTLKDICDHMAVRERAATTAEREFVRLKALQYLVARVGKEYDGIVSGVTSFGIFVELTRYLVEGLVHVASLGRERFELERDAHSLVGQKSGKRHRLGDRVKVRIKAVNPEERKADFVLV